MAEDMHIFRIEGDGSVGACEALIKHVIDKGTMLTGGISRLTAHMHGVILPLFKHVVNVNDLLRPMQQEQAMGGVTGLRQDMISELAQLINR